MSSFLRNHLTWIITTLVLTVLAWGKLSNTLESTVNIVNTNSVKIQRLQEFAIRQEAVNVMVEKMDKKLDRLLQR